MRRISLVIGCIALLALSCAEPVGPVLTGFERMGGWSDPAVERLTTDGSMLVVESGFLTPCEPYHATAGVVLIGSLVELRVRGKRRGNCPLDVIGTYSYRATVGGLESGTYAVRIVVIYDDASWPGSATTVGSISVP